MAPKSPWNKKSHVNTDAQNAGVQAAPPAINYAEVQEDEIEVLKAIYMEDFEEVEVKGAWSKYVCPPLLSLSRRRYSI